MPELCDGDLLRLQYLNNLSLDPEKVIIAMDFGRELFDYSLGCMGAPRSPRGTGRREFRSVKAIRPPPGARRRPDGRG